MEPYMDFYWRGNDMGLDITAYRQIKAAGPMPKDGDYDYETLAYLYVNQDFPGHAEGIDSETLYSFTEKMKFRAGSYSGYNEWRNELAKMAYGKPARYVWNNRKSGPFFELINFSDCEGALSASISIKLAADFAKYQPRADQWAETLAGHEGERFHNRYTDWRKAFEMAADNG